MIEIMELIHTKDHAMLHIKKDDAFIGRIFYDRVDEQEEVVIRLALFDTRYEIRCTGEPGEESEGELYDWDHDGNSREPGKEFIRSREYDILEEGKQAGNFALIKVQMTPFSIRPYYEMEYYDKKEHEGILLYYIYPIVMETEVFYCIYLSGQIAQVTKKENVYQIYGIDQESIGYGVLFAAYEYLHGSFLESIRPLGITQDPFLLKKYNPSFAQRCEDGKMTPGFERAYVNVTKKQ